MILIDNLSYRELLRKDFWLVRVNVYDMTFKNFYICRGHFSPIFFTFFQSLDLISMGRRTDHSKLPLKLLISTVTSLH